MPRLPCFPDLEDDDSFYFHGDAQAYERYLDCKLAYLQDAASVAESDSLSKNLFASSLASFLQAKMRQYVSEGTPLV